MKGEARKAAVAAYKERKTVAGVYLIRCQATGEGWVGQWPDVGAIQTRQWFTLRQGAHPNRALREAWRRHGEESFRFEVLERLEEQASPYIRDATLKERAAHWRRQLAAAAL
jgi:hypothetical protein